MSASTQLAEVDRQRAVRRVLWVTLVLNLVVAFAKIGYGFATTTLSVRADGFHSLTDGSSNIVGLIGVWLAARPPDEDHPYGHHKFEVIAASLVGLSLLAMAVDVALGAVGRLEGTAPLPRIDAGTFVVLGATLAVNVFVAWWERRRGRELGSAFLESDAAHTASDVLVTISILGAVALVRAGYAIVDVLAACGVAVVIARVGWQVLKRNAAYLTDSAQIDPERIAAIARATPGVEGAHRVRTRGAAAAVHVDLHIQVAGHTRVDDAHEITHDVIAAIRRELPRVVDVVVHTEPDDGHEED